MITAESLNSQSYFEFQAGGSITIMSYTIDVLRSKEQHLDEVRLFTSFLGLINHNSEAVGVFTDIRGNSLAYIPISDYSSRNVINAVYILNNWYLFSCLWPASTKPLVRQSKNSFLSSKSQGNCARWLNKYDNCAKLNTHCTMILSNFCVHFHEGQEHAANL